MLRGTLAPPQPANSSALFGSQHTIRILLKVVQEFGFQRVLPISGKFHATSRNPPLP
ncbi:hypothetical protein Q644_25580 [Brucella intermedia 229E]|uniref:Uncharacterized protein n=1 Tax=Brucella intermedia 229E TaxID=1337887 RepID=U4V7J3_9HYPH|nr:hypothetical protein Q644_25580 [Brucella intermedia 229E]